MSAAELAEGGMDPHLLRVTADHVAAGAEVLRAQSTWRGASDSCDQHVASGGVLSDRVPPTVRRLSGVRTHAEGLERARAALDHAVEAQDRFAGIVGEVTGLVPADVDVEDPEPIHRAAEMDRLALRLRQRATSIEDGSA